MNTVNPRDQVTQLIKRRTEIAITLRHVEREQMDIEAKEASMDREARASRLTLLRYLNDWYLREISEVDRELRRVGPDRCGFCSACHAPVPLEKLAVYSGVSLCADCLKYQKQL